MANNFVWLPNGSADAFEVPVRSNEPKIFRLKAPADAPTEPGPWIDYGAALTDGALTEQLSSLYWIDGYTNGDPDTALGDVDTTQDIITTKPQTWMASYPVIADPTLNEQYYQVGLTTLSLAGLLTSTGIGVGTPLPNQHGPETQGDVTGFTWHVVGGVTYEALNELDSIASQFTDVVLKYAAVPENLVQANTAYSTLQYQWNEYPTRDVLNGLTLIGSRSIPTAALGDWSTDFAGSRTAYVDLSFDIDVPSSLIVNGQVHVAYWLERVSQADRTLETTYSASYSTVQARTSWTSVPDGPLNAIFSISDAQDPTLSYESSYSTNPTVSGYWEKSGEEIWLASLGSTPGGRVGLTLFSWGLLLGPRVIRWKFSQISTNDFGVAIGIVLGTRVLVVTPTQVINIEASGTTVLATHSTPFSVGDQVDVKTTYDLPAYWDPSAVATGVVYRNGVQVSTFTWPSAYTYSNDFYTPTPWALAANSGNRISTIELTSVPTNRGLATVMVEFDKTNLTPTTSSFVADAGSVVQYRWLYPIGYPRAVMEDVTGSGHIAVMWVKFGIDTDVGELWYDFVNPEATDTPDLPYDEWSNIDTIASDAFMKRPDDGDLYTLDSSSYFDRSRFPVKPPILYNDDPTRMIWVTDDTHDTPYDMTMISKHFDLYRCFELGFENEWWTDEVWGDIWLYLHPRGRLPAPRVWSWQPGDDHGGLQYEGYTHNPVPLGPPPDVLTDGVVLHVEDSLEDWEYATREVYIGYTDDTGPFVYSALNQWNNMFPPFDTWGQYGYGYGAADDQGNIGAPVYYSEAWMSSRATLEMVAAADWRTATDFPSGRQSKAGFHSNYASDVVWSRDATAGTVGQRTTAGPTTVDSFFIFDPGFGTHGDPIFFDVEYNVGSDFGGVFVRWRWDTDNNETYYKISQSQIIHVVNGAETVLDSWSNRLSFRIIADGDTITVKDGSSGTTLSTVSAPVDQQPDDLIPRYLFGLWSRRPAGDTMRIARFMVTTTDFPSGWTELPSSAQSQAGWSLVSGADRFGESRGRAIRGALDWAMPTEPLPFDDSRWNGRNDLPDWNVRDIHWMVWLPAYPDSFFIQINANTWGVRIQDYTTLRLYEVNKLTGEMINELTPIYDHTTGSLNYTTSAIASPDGTKIWATTDVLSFATDNKLVEYDPVTETQTVLHDVPGLVSGRQIIGILPDGRELYQDYLGNRYWVYDSTADFWLFVTFSPYEGKGFNGGTMGWDGKWHVWGGQLNYHVDPRTYKLSAAEVAGTSTPPGTIVNLGGGEAKFFSEYYRYDIRDAGTIESDDNLFPDPSGGIGWAFYWADQTTCTGTSIGPLNGVVLFESLPDVQGMGTNTSSEIGGDSAYDIRMTTSLTEVIGFPDSITKILFSADMSSYGFASWGRLEVTQYDIDRAVVDVYSGPINQELLIANQGYDEGSEEFSSMGFESTLELQVNVHARAVYASFAFTFRIIPGTEEGLPADKAPYGRVRNVVVRGNDGAIPIEYMFNLDPEMPQTYCDVVRYIDNTYWDSWSGDGIQYQFPVLAFPATFVPQAGWTVETIGEEDPTPQVNPLILHGRGNAVVAGVTSATVTLSSPTAVGQTIVLVGYTNAGTPSGVSIDGLGATWHLGSQGSFIYAVGTAPTAGLTDITVSYPFASQFTVLAAAFSGAGAEKFVATGGDSDTPNTIDILKGDTTLVLNKYPPGGTGRPLSGQTAVVGWYVRGGSVGTATPYFTSVGGRYKQVPMIASGNGVTVELSHGSVIGDGGTNRVGHRTDNPTVYEGGLLVFAQPSP